MSDNLCKLLSEKYPDSFASWLLDTPQTRVSVLKTELSIEPIRADSVTFLQLEDRLLHIEFQTRIQSNPPLPLRMLDYWVRLYRLYRLPITQIVILLLPPAPGTIIETDFTVETTRHQYQVLRMWEQDPELFLNNQALLPLASLTASEQPRRLLERVAQKVSQLDLQQRSETAAYAEILAGLKYEKELVKQLFQEGIMRESVIYQEILQEGEQRGEQRGERRERSLVLRQLTKRVGELSPQVRLQIESLSIEQLENLGEALLDFSSTKDLQTWLEAVE